MTIPPIVLIAERRGDWVRVIPPNSNKQILLGNENRGLLVTWESSPVGWVRLAKPGPVPNSKIALWSVCDFGIAGIDY
jgi:hypothetical protein